MRARTLFVKFDTYFKWIMLTILLTRLAFNNSYDAATPPLPPRALCSPTFSWWTVFTCSQHSLCTHCGQSRTYIGWLMALAQRPVLQRKMFAVIFFMVNRHIRMEPSPNRIYAWLFATDCTSSAFVYHSQSSVSGASSKPRIARTRMRMIVVLVLDVLSSPLHANWLSIPAPLPPPPPLASYLVYEKLNASKSKAWAGCVSYLACIAWISYHNNNTIRSDDASPGCGHFSCAAMLNIAKEHQLQFAKCKFI